MDPKEQVFFDQFPWLADYIPLNRGIWSNRVKINKADVETLWLVPRDKDCDARIYLVSGSGEPLAEVRRGWFKRNDEWVYKTLKRMFLAEKVKYVVKVTYHDSMAGIQIWRFPSDTPAPVAARNWEEKYEQQEKERRRTWAAEEQERPRAQSEQGVAEARTAIEKALAEQ